MKQRLGACVLLCCLSAKLQATPNWPNAAYSYYAKDQTLAEVLRDFAGGFSLSLQMNPGLKAKVNGRFNTANPTEFIDRLGGVYGFNWFVYSGTLFVSRTNDIKTQTVNAIGGSISSLHDALSQLGVLDARFGWGELPDQNLALVSGPPEYVDLIKRTVVALPQGGGNQQVVVFRLHHASVNDRTISYRDQSVLTPGLATVLRNLISGKNSTIKNDSLSVLAAPLRDNAPTINQNNVVSNETPSSSVSKTTASLGAHTGNQSSQPNIQADARLNALIVQDIPERIPIYRQLIEQLDVPSTLIQIEAMIVDVNSELINQLGVTWGATAGKVSLGYSDLGLVPSQGLPIDSRTSEVLPGTLGISLGNFLVGRLRALETKGDANILSQPSILTTDNLGALIDLSETFYIQTRGERVATTTPTTVGTSLRVTPRYINTPEGAQVELTVDIEDGNIQTERPINGLPTVRKSNISTMAVIGDDQTLLIGGYNSTQNSQELNKTPILGDIPLLGLLFSNRSKTLKRRERLFLIRPKIVAINGEIVASKQVPSQTVYMGEAQPMTQTKKELDRATHQAQEIGKSQRTPVIFENPPQEQDPTISTAASVKNVSPEYPISEPTKQPLSEPTKLPLKSGEWELGPE